MALNTRSSACTVCSKRLNRKWWYYRNGKYYCKRRCWETEQEKASEVAEGPAAPAGGGAYGCRSAPT